MELHSDEELMSMVKNGNLDQMSVLFDRHNLHLYNFLFKMCHDKMLSEDLTQETFYKILKYRNSYNGGKFISWLFTIARNSLKTHFARQEKKVIDIFEIQYKVEAPEDNMEEDVSELHNAMKKLNESDREVLILNKLNDIKYEDLAVILSTTSGAVRTKVSRAMQKLRKCYFEE